MKFVSIDFWNTIYDSSNQKERHKYRIDFLDATLKKYDYNFSSEQLEEAKAIGWQYFNHHWKEKQYTPLSKETVGAILSHLSAKVDVKDLLAISEVFEDSVIAHPPQLLSGVKEAITNLSKKYKLALISDTGFSPGVILQKLLEQDGVLEYFSSFSFSNETGFSKPHRATFEKIINDLKFNPSLGIHIGDIEKTDIIGAKNVGMKAIRFLGDKNNQLNKDNPEISQADFEVHSWSEIERILLN
jgi:putative hydrolase of the HAD superfamily